MSKEQHYEEDESGIRQRNRTLRLSNRKARERHRAEVERSDSLYFTLLEVEGDRDAAQESFGKLWRSGLFDTGPQEYDLMVEIILEALRRANTAGTQPPFAA